jgi:cytosine/adenosine deaminase-related metal-dependent hydrolase
MMAVIEQSLRRHLAAGVTTVRDLGDRRFAVLDWRSSGRSRGVSTVAALASATALAADACGLGNKKGRLRAGYDADLLVVDGDPVADISALTRPTAVFAAGRRPAGT